MVSSTAGIHNNVSYEKTFWYPTLYKGTWIEAAVICRSFGMDLFTLYSQDEANHFYQILEKNTQLFPTYMYIGGVTVILKTKTEWFWLDTNEKVNFPMRFLAGDPNNLGGNEKCLGMIISGGSYYFIDVMCNAVSVKFVCQSVSH
jgi:hypothetical protein